MSTAAPDILVRRGLDRGLVGTVLVSAAIHAAALALLLTMRGRLLSTPPKMVSYTVDLIAPDVIGGTNLSPGAGSAKAPASNSGPAPVAAPKPSLAEPPAAKPAEAVAPLKEAGRAPAPEVPKAAEPAKPPPVAKPAPEPPKPAAAQQPVAVKPPDAKPVAPPKPAPIDAKPDPKPAAKAPEPPKPAAAEPAKVPAAVKPPAAPAKAAEPAKAPPAAKTVDDRIAAAVQRRAAQVEGGAGGTAQDADKQIAAAVQRRAQQVDSGSGSGAPGPGGPVSIGPGSGAGGTPADLEYILYQGKMDERIKRAWAWAGADKSRHAIVQFSLTPDGEIKNVRTVESSGDAQYDASCERAVRAANPLEPVPEKYRKLFATVEMTFKPSDLEP